ncbi:MAG: Bax inhibitor-1/YccA family protein, partial [Bacilli bacterium]|nr:Bax inhibitor-1/YccA family protein [Bacilli bacterium]
GCPKEYEWTASFGLAFTLIWLYVEILRLIILIVGRDN